MSGDSVLVNVATADEVTSVTVVVAGGAAAGTVVVEFWARARTGSAAKTMRKEKAIIATILRTKVWRG